VSWSQKRITLRPRRRGFHVITDEIISQVPELSEFEMGLMHLFLQHTSASLAINENVSADVRNDMESHFNRMVPEDAPYFTHVFEGADDMPAHIKSSLLGCSLTIPITSGRLSMGTWQGVYLCEHRDQGGTRRLVVTIHGKRKAG
jgi:secondary thiamine-phosphate synthase enzyme